MKKYLFTFHIFFFSTYVFSQSESDPSYQIYAGCWDDTKIEVSTVYEFPNGKIERNGENLSNKSKKYVYRNFDTYELTCDVSGFSIHAKYEKIEPRMRGPAGFLPTGRITLEIDGVPILSNANFLIGPSEYITSLRIGNYNEERIDIEICGASRYDTRPRFNGCMTFDFRELVSQSSPSTISDWFLSLFTR